MGLKFYFYIEILKHYIIHNGVYFLIGLFLAKQQINQIRRFFSNYQNNTFFYNLDLCKTSIFPVTY